MTDMVLLQKPDFSLKTGPTYEVFLSQSSFATENYS